MDRIVIEKNEIFEYIKVMYDNLNEFKNIVLEMNNLKKQFIENKSWESTSATIVLDKYQNILKEYLIFANKLMIYVDFLKQYVSSYDDVINEIKAEYIKLNEEYGMSEVYGNN